MFWISNMYKVIQFLWNFLLSPKDTIFEGIYSKNIATIYESTLKTTHVIIYVLFLKLQFISF